MSEFGIYINHCRDIECDLINIVNRLNLAQARTRKALKTLNFRNFHYVDNQLSNTVKSIDNYKNHVQKLNSALNASVSLYEKTESSIVENDVTASEVTEIKSIDGFDFSSLAKLLLLISTLGVIPGSALYLWLMSLYNRNSDVRTYELDSILFDNKGDYGGDQGKMADDYEKNAVRRAELLEDLREYFPNMTDNEALAYLKRLNSVGCSYVAFANTIFMQFEGDPQGFEDTFGFCMYKNGDLNYDRLILDIYATTDIDNINDGPDGMPEGTVERQWNEILNNYINEKGVYARTEINVDVNYDTYREINANGGKVVIAFRHGNMYDAQGNAHYIDGGHAMVVTGVTSDGKYIVSSWGDEYYINQSDLNFDDSFSVIYYN